MVDTQYPRDQMLPPSQYTSWRNANFAFSRLPLWDFRNDTTRATATLGGMTITMCTWSVWTLTSITSISLCIRGKLLNNWSVYSFTPFTNILRRNRGIHTMWYSVLYMLWLLFLYFIPLYPMIETCGLPPASPSRSWGFLCALINKYAIIWNIWVKE